MGVHSKTGKAPRGWNPSQGASSENKQDVVMQQQEKTPVSDCAGPLAGLGAGPMGGGAGGFGGGAGMGAGGGGGGPSLPFRMKQVFIKPNPVANNVSWSEGRMAGKD